MTYGRDGIYIPAEVFKEYIVRGNLLPKYMVFTALDALLGKEKTIDVDMPSQGKVTLTEQRNEGRYICHLLYASPILRGNIEVIEDIVPIYNIPLELKLPKKVTNVYTAPNNEKIEFVQDEESVRIVVPKVECHAMIVFEY